MPDVPEPVTRPGPPLMKLRGPSESSPENASAHIGSDAPLMSLAEAGLQGLHVHGPLPPNSEEPTTASSLGLSPSYRVLRASSGRDRDNLPKMDATATTPPLRSRPLQRLPARGSGMNEQPCLSHSPAPAGFLNLLARSSAPSLAAMLHAASAHGVAPFRALLLPCSRTPSPAPLPS
jgi:hypothetical protein